MSERFDPEDAAEVMRHLDDLEARYRELGVVEASLRDALRSVRRTRSELLQTLRRLDRLDAERAAPSESASDPDLEGESAASAGPGLVKAATSQAVEQRGEPSRRAEGTARTR